MQTASPFSHGGQSKPGQQQGSSRKRSRTSHSSSAAAQLVDRAFGVGPAEMALVLHARVPATWCLGSSAWAAAFLACTCCDVVTLWSAEAGSV